MAKRGLEDKTYVYFRVRVRFSHIVVIVKIRGSGMHYVLECPHK